MELSADTLFQCLVFSAVFFTVMGAWMPTVSFRAGGAFLWLICSIFILFVTGLPIPLYSGLIIVFISLFIFGMINFMSSFKTEKKDGKK
jgi:uncharacterized protein YacL